MRIQDWSLEVYFLYPGYPGRDFFPCERIPEPVPCPGEKGDNFPSIPWTGLDLLRSLPDEAITLKTAAEKTTAVPR